MRGQVESILRDRLNDVLGRPRTNDAFHQLLVQVWNLGNQGAGNPPWQMATSSNITIAVRQINFSVSHVDQVVTVAVSKELDVGIDVESIDQSVADGVMAEFCNLNEHAYIQALPELRRGREFIRTPVRV